MEIAISERPTLHELVTKSAELSAIIADAGGELTPELEAALKSWDLAAATKIDGYKFLIDRLEAEEAFWIEEADKRRKFADTCGKAAKMIRDRVLEALVELGKDEIQGETVKVKLTSTKGRLVVDEKELPEAYKVQETRMVADREKIRADLEQLVAVPGARIEGGLGLRFYTSKKKGELTNGN